MHHGPEQQRRGRGALAVLGACAALLACGAPSGPSSTGGGGGGGGSGGAGGDTTSSVSFAFDRRGARPDASRVTLDVVGLATFVDVDPGYVNADTPCDAGVPGALADLRSTVPLDLGSPGRTPFASVDLTTGRELREAWLVMRQGTIERDGRGYKVHNGAMCTMSDGLQYTLVRLRPGSPVPLGGPDSTFLAAIDARSQIEELHVDCRTTSADECRTADDPGDDGDPNTRLFFRFATSFPVTVETR